MIARQKAKYMMLSAFFFPILICIAASVAIFGFNVNLLAISLLAGLSIGVCLLVIVTLLFCTPTTEQDRQIWWSEAFGKIPPDKPLATVGRGAAVFIKDKRDDYVEIYRDKIRKVLEKKERPLSELRVVLITYRPAIFREDAWGMEFDFGEERWVVNGNPQNELGQALIYLGFKKRIEGNNVAYSR